MNTKNKQVYHDRYIPERKEADIAHFNLRHTNIDSLSDLTLDDEKGGYLEPSFVNTARKAKSILIYRKQVFNALGVKHQNLPKCSSSNKNNLLSGAYQWPVVSRKKPLMITPENVLDMPDIDAFETDSYRYVADWSAQGQIATIYQNEVHLLNCNSGLVANTKTNGTVTNCVKWDKSGNKFAVSRTNQRISIVDGKTLKTLQTVQCMCEECSITAFEWAGDDYLLAGCSSGYITTIISQNLLRAKIIGCKKTFNSEIVTIKLSCYNKYLLLSCLKGDTCILKWEEFLTSQMAYTEKFEMYFDRNKIKSAAWHPWKESVLVTGQQNNEVFVWNLNTHKCVDANILEPYFKEAHTCLLDFLTFNPLSAELLVSFYYENPDPDSVNGCNFLTVFRDLHTRVDEVRFHVGRVPQVLWDATGTRLATLGMDENLVIWNFFGTETIAEKRSIFQCRKNDMSLRYSYKNYYDIALKLGGYVR